MEWSLSAQLQEASDPIPEADLVEQSQASAPEANVVQQSQQIEWIGDMGEDAPLELLDNAGDLAGLQSQDAAYVVKRYNTQFILAVLGIIGLWALSLASYFFYQYLDLKSQPTVPVDKIERVQKVSDTYDQYGTMFGLFDKAKYATLSLAEQGETWAKQLLQDNGLNFVQKKDILQTKLSALGEQIIALKTQTKAFQESMNKDGFFPQELVDILKADNAVGSIQRSLLSLEVVKFSSAMKVFSLMDVFVSSLAENLWYTKSDIKEKLDTLMDRGEKDVEYYLNVCYNNPYEPTKCDKINDFDEYYKKILGESSFDTGFFKILMEFINNRLEFSNMPSFSITFNSFNGKSNSIGFTIEVNTLKEDEYALIQQGIKSPHIFIISELIKLLKQSTFIVGKAIDAKDIKVSPKQVTIGGSKYIVNNSVKTFNLPIQKTTEREIFDFMDSYISRIKDSQTDTGALAFSGGFWAFVAQPLGTGEGLASWSLASGEEGRLLSD